MSHHDESKYVTLVNTCFKDAWDLHPGRSLYVRHCKCFIPKKNIRPTILVVCITHFLMPPAHSPPFYAPRILSDQTVPFGPRTDAAQSSSRKKTSSAQKAKNSKPKPTPRRDRRANGGVRAFLWQSTHFLFSFTSLYGRPALIAFCQDMFSFGGRNVGMRSRPSDRVSHNTFEFFKLLNIKPL